MSEKDKVMKAAEQVGGWENLARGLYALHSTGSNELLKAFIHAESKKGKNWFNLPRRGAPTFYTLGWGWKLEDIIAAAKVQNPYENDKGIIGRRQNLRHLYGKELGATYKDRNSAIKTVSNRLVEHRKREKLRLMEPTQNPYVDPFQHIEIDEDYPTNVQTEDDPRKQF